VIGIDNFFAVLFVMKLIWHMDFNSSDISVEDIQKESQELLFSDSFHHLFGFLFLD